LWALGCSLDGSSGLAYSICCLTHLFEQIGYAIERSLVERDLDGLRNHVVSLVAPFKGRLHLINHQRARADGAFAISRCSCTLMHRSDGGSVLQGHGLTDPLRETVAHKTSRPDRASRPRAETRRLLWPNRPNRRAARHQPQRRNRDEQEEGAEPSAVFGEVETIDEIAPTMLALLRALPSGTRIYLRLKQALH